MKTKITLIGTRSSISSAQNILDKLGVIDFIIDSMPFESISESNSLNTLYHDNHSVLRIIFSPTKGEILIRSSIESRDVLESALEWICRKHGIFFGEIRSTLNDIDELNIRRFKHGAWESKQIVQKAKIYSLITDFMCSLHISIESHNRSSQNTGLILRHVNSEITDREGVQKRSETYLVNIPGGETIVFSAIFGDNFENNVRNNLLKHYFPFGLLTVKWSSFHNDHVIESELENIISLESTEKLLDLIPSAFILDFAIK
jgi:hypothetical protein